MYRPGDKWRVGGVPGSKSIAVVSAELLLGGQGCSSSGFGLLSSELHRSYVWTPTWEISRCKSIQANLFTIVTSTTKRDFVSKAPQRGTFRHAPVVLPRQSGLARRVGQEVLGKFRSITGPVNPQGRDRPDGMVFRIPIEGTPIPRFGLRSPLEKEAIFFKNPSPLSVLHKDRRRTEERRMP